MTEVHRYSVVKMLSDGGNRISYDPYGPEVVMASAYDQLKAENEALRKDAARYRWLNTKSTTGPNICVSEWVGPHEYPLIGDELDAAIDAAMGKGGQS